MDSRERADLHDFVRTRHVHYELEPEETTGSAGRERVSVRIRLLATHERERLGTPGCPPCAQLLGELDVFARRIAAEAGVAVRAETIPALRKLISPRKIRTPTRSRSPCGSGARHPSSGSPMRARTAASAASGSGSRSSACRAVDVDRPVDAC